MKLREIIKEYGLGQVVRPLVFNSYHDSCPFWIMEKEGLQVKIGYFPCGSLKGLSWKNRIARIEINSGSEYEIVKLTNIELACLVSDVISEDWKY
jgi:hypothetical protein